MGRQRNLGAHHLVYLRDLSAHASCHELEGKEDRYAFDLRLLRGAFHLYRGQLSLRASRVSFRAGVLMAISLIGISHRTAPVELREKLSFNVAELTKALEDLRGRSQGEEAVLLSTCNRTEL